MRLYDLSEQYQDLLDLVEEGYGDPQELLTMIEGIKEEINKKVVRTGLVIKQLNADAEMLNNEIKRLQERKKSVERGVDDLKAMLFDVMQKHDMNKVKDPLATVWIQNNPPSVNVLNEEVIPSAYWIPQPDKLDKSGISKRLKEGEVIEGVELQVTQGVRIR